MYAVFDVETTGFAAHASDRIVEIGLVLTDLWGNVEDEWVTILNPERDLGPSHIHGIYGRHAMNAPRFADVAPHLMRMLRGRTLVAHNASFDLRFLNAETARIGAPLDLAAGEALCTMQLAKRLLPGAKYTLDACCQRADVPDWTAHSALGDARATAQLFQRYLSLYRPKPPAWADVVGRNMARPWPNLPLRSFSVVSRDDDVRSRAACVNCQVKPHEAGYWNSLESTLADGVLTVEEARQLGAEAAAAAIAPQRQDEIHRLFVADLARRAWEDGVLTDDERARLTAVAHLLSLGAHELDDAIAHYAAAPAQRKPRAVRKPVDLAHPGVVFTGGDTLSRSEWTQRAEDAGFTVKSDVSRHVAFVVAADPDSLSGKARRARELDIPIVSYAEFGARLGSVDQG